MSSRHQHHGNQKIGELLSIQSIHDHLVKSRNPGPSNQMKLRPDHKNPRGPNESDNLKPASQKRRLSATHDILSSVASKG